MAVIGKIRKRAGLIVALVGIALFSFVLSDMFFKGQSLFSSEQTAGEVAGNSISLIAFDNEVQRIADVQKERRRQAALDDETMNSIRDRVWEKFVNELALKPQFQDAGISVSDGEVKELILGNDPDPMVVQYFTDPNSNKLIPYFTNPMTGRLRADSVKSYVDKLPPEEKPRWTEFEDMLRDNRVQSKYLTLIKKGLYVTTEQAKADYANLNRSVDFKYIFKPFSSLSDSLVQVNEQDKLKFYNENSYKYKQDASRKLEYIVFDIKPTQLDFDEVKSQLDKLAEEWKDIKSKKEDSLLVVRESDTRAFDTTHYGKGQLPLQIDSLAHASEKGTVLPIFMENNQYKLAKVIDYEMLPDSVKARHILIKVPAGDTIAKAKAKIKIDSIKSVIQKKHNFAEMAKKFSDDAGSKDTGGVLGWFTTGKMVPEFQNACFHGKKGDMPVALSKFGYHLIEILDQGVVSRKTEVGIIERKVIPGSKTTQDVYNSAVDFVTKYHTSETFEKGVEEMHLLKRLADQLKENDKTIPGIDNPKEIIRWAFNAKKGDVSTDPFRATEKFIVAHVAEIREEGIAPIEQKKEEVEAGAKKMKKAEKFIEEMKKIHASSIEEYASKLNLQVNPAEGATFTSYSIPNVGRELNLYGPLFSLKKGEMSKPIAGEAGVYIVKIENIKEAPPTTDFSQAKSQSKNNFSYRADIEAIDAIKKKAEIKDNRAKFF